MRDFGKILTKVVTHGFFLRQRNVALQYYSQHSPKKQIVWKNGPNWPLCALMLRTKLYQNPFFFTGHQNVNKPKSRAARTVYGLIFLLFYKIIVSFFSFLCQDANKIRSNCAIIGCNFSKKHKLTQYKTERRVKLRRS